MLTERCEFSDEMGSVYYFDVTLANTRISSLLSRRLVSSRFKITADRMLLKFQVSS